jgi:crotonobetainyl-CoA:carnitine CoA-transferase CaiB-like acyl-CoA transferase
MLADLGMEVIKVEPPGGDPVRRLGPFARDKPHLEGSLRFAHLNAGKRSLTLDLEAAQGRDLLLQLVEQVDVVLESFDPGRLDELGLGRAELQRRNPALVLTSITGFGQTGPFRDYLAPDIVGFAMGGLMYISGDQALPPVKAPETQAFYAGCLSAAFGTLLALWQRDKAGEGATVDVSIQETIASQEQLIRAAALDGKSIRRHGSQHEYNVPSNIFPTLDGAVYLFVVRQHWRKFLSLWPEHPSELESAELELNHVRHARGDWINGLVRDFTRQFTADEFVDLMQRNGIPCMRVNPPTSFMRDEQTRFRQFFQPTQHPVLGEYVQPSFPVLLDGVRAPAGPPPLLGQHTRAILIERAGLTDAQVGQLFAQGIV